MVYRWRNHPTSKGNRYIKDYFCKHLFALDLAHHLCEQPKIRYVIIRKNQNKNLTSKEMMFGLIRAISTTSAWLLSKTFNLFMETMISPTSNPEFSAGVSASMADMITGLDPCIRKPYSPDFLLIVIASLCSTIKRRHL